MSVKDPKKGMVGEPYAPGMQDGNDNNDNQLQSSCKSKKSSRNKANIDWSGHQCVVIEAEVKKAFDQRKVKPTNTPLNLAKKLMLDSGSTIEATIQNSDFLTNIRTSENPIVMSTNAGYKKMGLDGDLPGIGVVKYDGNKLANILGLSHMADRYRIEYDISKEDAFKVHTKNGIVKFTRDGRLYTYQPSTKFFDSIAETKGLSPDTEAENKNSNKSDSYNSLDFVMTKKGNRDGYTDRQYERAKRAWKLYINTGGGGFENFKHYLRQNLIKNNPVTAEDANIAEKIFVKDVGHLKGSTVRKSPDVIQDHKIEIPRELVHQCDDLILFIDLFYVNGLPMLTSIDSPIRNRNLVSLETRTKESIYKGLDVILRDYNRANYFITKLQGNHEFGPLLTDLEDNLDIELDIVAQGDHVPEAERNNRTIGERIRAGYHRLPYKAIPKVMLIALAKLSTRQLNFYPAKNGVSPYYSPYMLLQKRNLQYDKHCTYTFGSYVQAAEENRIKNDNKPRTVDGIYLEPNMSPSGGHWIMNIVTGAKMHKARVWEVPITESVIPAVESLAESQGYKSLKLQGKNKTRLLPGDWDEEDEYIYNDDYDDEDKDEDAEDEEDELKTFDEVDENEVDDITNDNNNNNNDVAEADGDNIVANPAQNVEIIVKDVNDDDKDDEESNENQAENAETDDEVENKN